MHRFFNANIKPTDRRTSLTDENFLHARALRLKNGEHIIVCDGAENDYHCIVTLVSKARIGLEVVSSKSNKAEPQISVTLFQALPKTKKMHDVIENCVPLGISSIVPVITTRCLANYDSKESNKTERWHKTSEAAAKQSGRGTVPIVKKIMEIDDAIDYAKQFDAVFVCYEDEDKLSLNRFFSNNLPEKPGSIAFFIGPEGGFTDYEIKLFKNAGIPAVSLGPRILRTELAGAAVLSAIMYQYEKEPHE